MRTSIVILLGLGLIASSCNDNDEPEDQTDTTQLIEASLKPYLFKAGSFWIYENDSDGSFDSIAVIETDSGIFWNPPSVHGAPGQKHEFYNIFYKNFSNSLIFNDFLDHSNIRRNGGDDYEELGQPIFKAGEEIGAGYNGMEIVNILPELVINEIAFRNVYQVMITAVEQYQDEFEYDTYLYYSDSIGVIKQEFLISTESTETWNLIRWKTFF